MCWKDLGVKLQKQLDDQEDRFNLMVEQVNGGHSARSSSSGSSTLGRGDERRNRFRLNGKIKPGARQMITQAWSKILMTSWDNEMTNNMNEVFSFGFVFPNVLATEVFTDTEPIARSVRRRGLHAEDSLTLSSGWDFCKAGDRARALDLVRRRRPYVIMLAFPCGPVS